MLDYAAITTSSTLTSLEHSHHPTYLTAKWSKAPLSYVSRHCLSHLREQKRRLLMLCFISCCPP
jgi:hypothetical protein